MATKYIATNGNDGTGDGSVGTPWLTLAFAMSEIGASDTLIIVDGDTYAEAAAATITPPANAIVQTQGAVGAEIDVSACDAGEPALKMSYSASIDGSAGQLILDGQTTFDDIICSISGVTASLSNVTVERNAATNKGVSIESDAGADTEATLTNCIASAVGTDGFSAYYYTAHAGLTITAVFDYCTAVNCGEDGFTSHYGSCYVRTTGCEASGGQTGYAPAYGSSWTSRNDYLHDNDSASRATNVYLIGGCNFVADGLRLGGAQTTHIMVGSPTGAECSAVFTHMLIDPDSSVDAWINILNSSGSDADQNMTFQSCMFQGLTASHAIDDTDRSNVRMNLVFDSCVLHLASTTTAGKYLLISRDSRATTIVVTNSVIRNDNGDGAYLLNSTANAAVIRNSIVRATGNGIAGAVYGSESGYNVVQAGTAFAVSATAKTGDVSADAAVDANYVPLRGGNCDVGCGNPNYRHLGEQDVYGRPKLRGDADCIGPAYPQRKAVENVLLPVVQFATEAAGN